MAYASSTCGISQQPANFSKLSFETVVLKGLAADGGLFLPEEVPIVTDWVCTPSVQHSAQILPSRDIFFAAFEAVCLSQRLTLDTSGVGKIYRTPS